MAIVYDKLRKKLKEKGINSYTMKKSNAITQGTFHCIMAGKSITMKTLDKLCGLLDCQPGELIEYVPDQDQEKDHVSAD